MESLIDWDIAFFPLFSPGSSFTHSILSGFSPFPLLTVFPRPIYSPGCLNAKARLEERGQQGWRERVVGVNESFCPYGGDFAR